MKKNILGLDLGTTSIGWAYVKEGSTPEKSSIEQIGVRVNPLSTDEANDFERGRPITINAERTLKRGARRNLDRYQLRRDRLIKILKDIGFISEDTPLTEIGNDTTFETWELRAKSVTQKVGKEELARIFLAINKKRGYKSSRKAKNEEEGELIDGMEVAKKMHDKQLTPGQFVFQLLQSGKKYIPDFYRSDLEEEFERVWSTQRNYHPNIFTESFYKEVKGKGKRATSATFWNTYKFNTADIKDIDDDLKTVATAKYNKRELKRLQEYKWRSDAIRKRLEKEQAAYVITEINNNINSSSGYLSNISDRSKELYFNQETVGQYLYRQILNDPHTQLKNQVFYRQDYEKEFDAIWQQQSKYYPELTGDLKVEIADKTIFYQRPLKSQKGLVSFCEFESQEKIINGKKRTIGSRVAPRSSPLFQEFKIWQVLNNFSIRKKINDKKKISNLFPVEDFLEFDQEAKQALFDELNIKGNLTFAQAIRTIGYKPSEWESNYKTLEGNNTNKVLYDAYLKILEVEGYNEELLKLKTKDAIDVSKLATPAVEIKEMVKQVFESLGINTEILEFDPELKDNAFEKQASYQLWHLLYSYESDDSKSGNETLYRLLQEKFGFDLPHARILANVAFVDDYASLSTKAMRKIFPYIKENKFSTACEYAGYKHSKNSLTKEENESRELKNKLELLKKNSLRNPVVEKILNQMINLINELIDKNSKKDERGNIVEYFKFDEIRIELARELKQNAEGRAEMIKGIEKGKRLNDGVRTILQKEFGIKNPSRNDIIRYRLYDELQYNGYKDLYTDTYIPREKLFSNEIDVDHIIPQSRVFDDSFSNKTVVYRKTNLEKGNQTAFDYIKGKFGEKGLIEYVMRIETFLKSNSKSKAKYNKLLMPEAEIGEGFVERDLRNTQYIARKAREILLEISRNVVPTSGNVTARLREDWGLINVMKELNINKYRALGRTIFEERKDGQQIEMIEDWSKRDDHRHHAMDALIVAFTKHNHIQYLNYLNARKDEGHKYHKVIQNIEAKELKTINDNNGNWKRQFIEPVPNFRDKAKTHLQNTLVSHKAKNKVVTQNKNEIMTKNGKKVTIELTPRGQLHNETVYGRYQYYETKTVNVNGRMDKELAQKIVNKEYREAVLKRLKEYEFIPRKAFAGNNSLSKNPIYLDSSKTTKVPSTVKISWLEERYSIRKEVNPDNFNNAKSLEKVIDVGVRRILQKRLKEYDNKPKDAFSDLDKNPIWFNKEKRIPIKRVTITGVRNAETLNYKKNHLGEFILDKNNKKIPTDFVSTGNNHHVAIYEDEKGNYHEQVVSFYEAVVRVNQGLSIIDETFNQSLGWKFLFTMKQNEMFVFPNEETGFNPQEINLLNPKNKSIISENLFRVQKIATRNYMFRHHKETTVETIKALRDNAFKHVRSANGLKGMIKVRVNHLGDIVSQGEY